MVGKLLFEYSNAVFRLRKRVIELCDFGGLAFRLKPRFFHFLHKNAVFARGAGNFLRKETLTNGETLFCERGFIARGLLAQIFPILDNRAQVVTARILQEARELKAGTRIARVALQSLIKALNGRINAPCRIVRHRGLVLSVAALLLEVELLEPIARRERG